jgi:hypothetical protein
MGIRTLPCIRGGFGRLFGLFLRRRYHRVRNRRAGCVVNYADQTRRLCLRGTVRGKKDQGGSCYEYSSQDYAPLLADALLVGSGYGRTLTGLRRTSTASYAGGVETKTRARKVS